MKRRQAAIGFVLVTVLIDIMGLGIILPIIPDLIQELTGGDVSEASVYGGWLLFVYAFMQFLFAPILGGLSDKFGRRPILLISLFGLGIDYIIVAMAPDLYWLFIARVIAGIGGASFTTANAYIADISKPDERAKNFGMIGAAFGLGFIIGPLIGGGLGQFGTRIPFFAAAGLTLLNWLYGYFVVPESLSKENRREFTWKRANPVGTLMQLRKYPIIVGLLSALFMLYLAAHATQSTWTYFTKERYGWCPWEIGLSLAFVGFMVALVQGVLIGPIVAKIGEVKAVYTGLIFNALGLLLIAFAVDGWMLYAIMVPYAFGGLATPALQGIMTSQLPPDEQGELQGGLTSMASVTAIFGPLMMTNIFAFFTAANAPEYFPGAPFLMGAFLAGISTLMVIKPLMKFIRSKSAAKDE